VEIADLRETAALAHLNPGEAELAGALPAFEEMLGYFALMQAADGGTPGPASGISALARTVASGHFRGDGPSPASGPPEEDRAEEMLAGAAERDGRFVVVPNVL
jgi:aspartyl-tRNA(Asn)/glutamyl-tRNA(Gln) amidotransferase subunit C